VVEKLRLQRNVQLVVCNRQTDRYTANAIGPYSYLCHIRIF